MATPGQPTKYKPDYDELAHKLLPAGRHQRGAGRLLRCPRIINNWIATYPDFADDDIVALLDAAGESMRHAGD